MSLKLGAGAWTPLKMSFVANPAPFVSVETHYCQVVRQQLNYATFIKKCQNSNMLHPGYYCCFAKVSFVLVIVLVTK